MYTPKNILIIITVFYKKYTYNIIYHFSFKVKFKKAFIYLTSCCQVAYYNKYKGNAVKKSQGVRV